MNKDKVIDKIYNKFDREMYAGRFGRIKKILLAVECYKVEPDFLISLLTVTLPVKEKLGIVRDIFFNRVDIRCTQKGVNTDSLLEGLD